MYPIEDNLYFSNYEDVTNYTFEKDRLYTIFNCTRDLEHILRDNVNNYRLSIDDYPCDETFNEMIFNIPNFVRIIKRDMDEGRIVIVHCRMGISRSATLISAFLIWKYKISVDFAIERVRVANPNALFYLHFYDVLKSLEKISLLNKYTHKK